MSILYSYIPCYNEEGNIASLLEAWVAEKEKLAQSGYELRVIPIDDKSRDNTLEIMREIEKKYDCIHVIAHEVNKNLSGGLNTAINHFHEHGREGDLMSFMDGDYTHRPEFIHSMIEKLNTGLDCVIASRYQEGSTISGVPKNREFLSDAAKVYYSVMLNVPNVRDYTCGYRVYTYNAIKNVKQAFGDEVVTMKSFACMMEILYKVHKSGARFGEVPFNLYYESKLGNSNMRVFKTMLTSLVGALSLRIKTRREKHN